MHVVITVERSHYPLMQIIMSLSAMIFFMIIDSLDSIKPLELI